MVGDGLDHFDDSGDAGGGGGVADVGFDRSEPERVVGGVVAAVGVGECLGFDGVAQSGAGAVGFHDVDLVGGQAGVGECGEDDALLGGPVGCGESVAGAVLVDCAATDHRQHLMTITAGVGKPFQQHQTHTLGPGGTVRSRGKRLAPAVGGQTPLTTELHEDGGSGHDRDAAGEGQITLTTFAASGQRDEQQPATTNTRYPRLPPDLPNRACRRSGPMRRWPGCLSPDDLHGPGRR